MSSRSAKHRKQKRTPARPASARHKKPSPIVTALQNQPTRTAAAVTGAVLIAAAALRRKGANGRARSALNEARFARLLLDMSQGLMGKTPDGSALANWAKGALERRLRQLRKQADRFDRLDAAGRHRLRIAAKHLRYARMAAEIRADDV